MYIAMRIFLAYQRYAYRGFKLRENVVFESKAFIKLIYVKSGLFSGYFHVAASLMLFSAFGVHTDRQMGLEKPMFTKVILFRVSNRSFVYRRIGRVF